MKGDPSEHGRLVGRYYDRQTEPFYRRLWNGDDLHLGLFDGGVCTLPEALKAMTRAVTGPLDLRAGQRVLDAGCGVGGTALDLARWHGCEVLGLTVSPVQVGLARLRAAAAGLDGQLSFDSADCSISWPVPDGSVHAVVSIEAACHMADRPGFLAGCHRVLRPGGLLAMSDWLAVDGISDADRNRFLAPVCTAWSLAPDLETLGSWKGLLVEAGFEVIEALDLGDAVLENARLMQQALLGLLLGEAARDHLPEQVASWKEHYRTLATAWMARRFTIGRLLARRRHPGPAGT